MKRTITSILGLIVILATAYGLDRVINQYERTAQETFAFRPLWWVMVASYLIFSVLVIGLAWWVFREGSRTTSLIFIGLGFLCLPISLPIGWSVANNILRSITGQTGIIFPIPGQLFFIGSALVTAIGLFSLFSRTNNRPAK